jgi:hypothetical protein
MPFHHMITLQEAIRIRMQRTMAQATTGYMLEIGESEDRIAVPGGCPICLRDKFRIAMRTNCGHAFCATCLLRHYHTNRLEQAGVVKPVECPMCRTHLTRFDKGLRESPLRERESVNSPTEQL